MGLLIVFFLTGGKGILHQRTDGHGPYSTRNRRDERAFGSHLVELHVAIQTETAMSAVTKSGCPMAAMMMSAS